MIARLSTQRTVLSIAALRINPIPGYVLEVGLGKGRTFDHLRRLLPGRVILAFDRSVHAPPDCVPDPDCLILGDFRDTLAGARDRLRGKAALIHADIGSEDRDRDHRLTAAIGPLLGSLLAPCGILLSDRPMPGLDRLRPLRLPASNWPYHGWIAPGPATTTLDDVGSDNGNKAADLPR